MAAQNHGEQQNIASDFRSKIAPPRTFPPARTVGSQVNKNKHIMALALGLYHSLVRRLVKQIAEDQKLLFFILSLAQRKRRCTYIGNNE